jgi:hypothetical protein
VAACKHLTNFTSDHESRAGMIGEARFDYPDSHIEADHRLSWFLGDLGNRFPDAYFVHLRRDPVAVAASFAARAHSPFRPSMYRAFAHGIVMAEEDWDDAHEVARFYVDVVTANIDQFLVGRRSETMWLEEAESEFPGFLERIRADGDLAAATAEWQVRHNATTTVYRPGGAHKA